MKAFRLDNALPLDTTIPDNALVCLIGAAGAGKSTWASTWPGTQVLELDRFRALVSDDAGKQEATDDAVFALQAVLEARLARGLMTVVDATNSETAVRAGLIATARRHGVPTVALVVPTPASVCVERQDGRPDNRSVPAPIVRAQHAAVVDAWPGLPGEGFDHVVVAENIHRLEPLLQRLSDARRADLGWDGCPGLGDLLLVRRVFGPEILPMWCWRDGSQLADGDRVAEIRLGADRILLVLRTDVDGAGDVGFEVLVGCPVDDECDGQAWAPAYNVTDLLRALTGALMTDPDVHCTVHGGTGDVDQEADDHDLQSDDPEGRADLEEQYADAILE
ncbi:ATP-binding protein [Streptomyces griseorubiginosus]|uniref:ATP/GTP-binding protein n=1 Tax=Streptomyces griseorubiginosus TaxID=67304 RepID=A0A117QWW9_9ACTN|nr:ATP-binding protein [Streptomyces griseorubiginosus]KUN58439.1 ATP/GTP-binding protein [Streptomyces griseorubiginosus]